ncbi:hypothetical protein DPMN_115698 [Dreissena polymorpha]|uniref:Uncharacterized protein n=1 Tax=Dreissena polymorpha TaxID=45954 RepID=A0A9D4KMX8_DREPO|nr:hypothetical protein DPMN_115698 [Dreissena polymorpha]
MSNIESAPLVFSQPHFLNADPGILNAVIGMRPDPDEHGTFIDIEPSSVVTKELADEFKSQLQIPVLEMNVGIYVAIGVGALMIVSVVLVAIIRRRRPTEIAYGTVNDN